MVVLARNQHKIQLRFENGRNELGNVVVALKTFDRVEPFDIVEDEPKLQAISEFAQLVADATNYTSLIETAIISNTTIL